MRCQRARAVMRDGASGFCARTGRDGDGDPAPDRRGRDAPLYVLWGCLVALLKIFEKNIFFTFELLKIE